ncbi:hypothetical protein [Desulfohalovibrio reitneri]|uniref:hypothetical protein n=1 Tax=Desulfohalovibrio reitneri TaxID=1307759 RepID=UPI0004A70971|nr:hypothetical protein [Desulfohalovibrio reitneri]
MPENIQKSMGVMAAVFAHLGKISKEEALKMSGLSEAAFEEVYNKAGNVASKMQKTESNKVEHFFNALGEEVDDYMKTYFI